jgi:hypothetical protein
MKRMLVLSMALLLALLAVCSTAESAPASRPRTSRPASSNAGASRVTTKPKKATAGRPGDERARIRGLRATDEEAFGTRQPPQPTASPAAPTTPARRSTSRYPTAPAR